MAGLAGLRKAQQAQEKLGGASVPSLSDVANQCLIDFALVLTLFPLPGMAIFCLAN